MTVKDVNSHMVILNAQSAQAAAIQAMQSKAHGNQSNELIQETCKPVDGNYFRAKYEDSKWSIAFIECYIVAFPDGNHMAHITSNESYKPYDEQTKTTIEMTCSLIRKIIEFRSQNERNLEAWLTLIECGRTNLCDTMRSLDIKLEAYTGYQGIAEGFIKTWRRKGRTLDNLEAQVAKDLRVYFPEQ